MTGAASAGSPRVLATLVLGAALATVGAGLSWRGSSGIDPILFSYGSRLDGSRTTDVWFDADLPKIYCIAADAATDRQGVSSEHPLVSFAVHSTTRFFRAAGAGYITALRLLMAGVAAVWGALLFGLLKRICVSPVDAGLLTLVGLTSATAQFWLAVPEVFPLGSVTILAALWLVGAPRLVPSSLAVVAASALSLSMTVTNWSVAVTGALLRLTPRRAAATLAVGVVLVMGAWWVQSHLFPGSVMPFSDSGHMRKFLFIRNPLSLLRVVASMFLHTLVMPAVEVTRWQSLRSQLSLPGSGGAWGVAALLAWLLFGAGVAGAVASLRRDPLAGVLLGALALQLLLHLVFGAETFLYSMHYLVLLIPIAGYALVTRIARPARLLAAALLLCGAVNNEQQLQAAQRSVHQLGDELRQADAAAGRPDRLSAAALFAQCR